MSRDHRPPIRNPFLPPTPEEPEVPARDGGHPAGDGGDVGAFRHEVLDHLDVAAGRRVVQRGVAFVVARVDVGMKILDQILDGGEHA